MNRVVGSYLVVGLASLAGTASGQVFSIDFESFSAGDTGAVTSTGIPSQFGFNGNALLVTDTYLRSIPEPPFSEPVFQTVVDSGLSGAISGKAVSGDLSGNRNLYSVDFSVGGGSGGIFPEFYVGTFGIGSTLAAPLEIDVVRFGQTGSILGTDRHVIPAGSPSAPGILEIDLSSFDAMTQVSIQNVNDTRDLGAVTFIDNFVYSTTPIPAPASLPLLVLGGLVAARRRRGGVS